VPLAVVLLSLVLMYSMARTAAFQRTVRALGLMQDAPHGARPSVSSQRTLILLSMYLRRVNAMFLLGMALYLLTARASAWYYGTAVLALCCLGSALITPAPWLRLGANEMTSALVAELERRRERYRMVRDAGRLETVEDLLRCIRSSSSSTRRAEVQR
jgi:hypothetical protein